MTISEKQRQNFVRAQAMAFAKNQGLKQQRIRDYYQNPKCCLQCGTIIDYEKKRECKFCDRSCAASYNGRKRLHSIETKKKIAKSLTGKTSSLKGSKKIKDFYDLCFKICPICSKNFYTHGRTDKWSRKTCSRECQIVAVTKNRPYQNGSRKNIKYYNKHQQKEVLLESSWEKGVAIRLDERDIRWLRPEPIRWIDSKEKSRMYYPDFYLPDYELYLDPKNPYCMQQDKEKMAKVCQLISLEYGSLDHIFDVIEMVCDGRRGEFCHPNPTAPDGVLCF